MLAMAMICMHPWYVCIFTKNSCRILHFWNILVQGIVYALTLWIQIIHIILVVLTIRPCNPYHPPRSPHFARILDRALPRIVSQLSTVRRMRTRQFMVHILDPWTVWMTTIETSKDLGCRPVNCAIREKWRYGVQLHITTPSKWLKSLKEIM